MTNLFPRLGSLCSGAGCCGCLDGCPVRWKIPLASTLGLGDGSCSGCSQFNLDYIVKSSAPGVWTWENANDYPIFLCRSNGDGSQIYNTTTPGDSVVFVLYQPACSLTISANNDGTCSYIATWSMGSAWEYIGDDNVLIPGAISNIGYTVCGGVNRATWRYNSSYGEPCNTPKTLTLGTQANDVLVPGWCGMMHVENVGPGPDPFGGETGEPAEGNWVYDGPFCSAGPSFAQTITIEPMP